MDPVIISTVMKAIGSIASLIHGDDVDKVKSTVQALIAAVVAQLPDGSQITEEQLAAHADQIIADAEARRQRINSDDGA